MSRRQREYSADVLIDAHVHCYGSFDVRRLLDAAASNFAAAARSFSTPPRYLGVLVLTQTPEEASFGRLRDSLQEGKASSWKLEATAERISFLAMRADGVQLLIVAGIQLVTHEGIEVLGLGLNLKQDRRQTLSETLQSVRNADGLPILPWGFGKWWARRGNLVLDVINKQEPDGLFVADSGVRLRHSPEPRVLQISRRQGFRNLPGTDLFPVAGEEERAGSFGAHTRTYLSSSTPAAELITHLRSATTEPRGFGSGLSYRRFVRLQTSMIWRKHAPEFVQIARVQ